MRDLDQKNRFKKKKIAKKKKKKINQDYLKYQEEKKQREVKVAIKVQMKT